MELNMGENIFVIVVIVLATIALYRCFRKLKDGGCSCGGGGCCCGKGSCKCEENKEECKCNRK